MGDRPRFVFDTNVIVSALAFPSSKPRQAFDLAERTGVILISAETLDELVATLRRPKLAAYITPAEREAFLHALSETVQPVAVTERVSLCRDPRDDKFLELAAAGRASHLVTGDADLLTIGRFGSTLILPPADLLTLL
jgi:uncharacterized protein